MGHYRAFYTRSFACWAAAKIGDAPFDLDKTIGLCFQRRCKHALRAFSRNLRQQISNDAGLAQGDDRVIVLHRRIAPQEVLAGSSTRHDTPPSQVPSPIFSHS
jgi:hypothetical protein